MSYTPTNWQTGDTITAEKMNNIEQGIQNAQNVAVVSLDAEGFDSGSKTFGYVVYATYDGEKWVVTNDNNDEWPILFGYAKPIDRIIPPQFSLVADNMCPFFIHPFDVGDTEVQTTGDIEQANNLYFGYVSHIENAYRIYGNGSIKLIAL